MTALHISEDVQSHIPTTSKGSKDISAAAGSATPPNLFSQTEPFARLTLYTGNTMRTGTTGSLNTNQKKSNQELVCAVDETLHSSLANAQVDGTAITIADESGLGPLEDNRSKYDITVKMFFLSESGSLRPLSVEQLDAASQYLRKALGYSDSSEDLKIDNFVLAIPNQTFDENDLDEAELEAFSSDVEQLYLPVWKKLSEWRQSGQIARLGVSEFSKKQLETLKAISIATAEKGEPAVAPELNQVNLSDCCVLPRDLIDYAKSEGIELLTHGDATNILPKSTLTSLLQGPLPATANSPLRPNFVLKYSVFLRGRGLVTRKGYIVDAISA
ncbi:hypothetical protein BGW38_005702 [Lunasporangiospora selenospora]|uniref:GCS light chain n=1 Tax=Lunasporangiospora selenospora TaxID=979761 RepID=A0A9P6FN37_9FUNG|nr:hypothetical protein BGW38_005702 [Lunasporangiospora selenospora]